MTDKIVVFSACASPEEAEKIARLLIDERLAACVNVISGARSFFLWQGAVQADTECLLVVKSSRALFPALAAAIEKAHAYEIPEVIAVPIVEGSANYLNWMDANLLTGSGRE